MARILHVALLIETSRAYGRGLLQGINGYLRNTDPGPSIFNQTVLARRHRGG